jgi:hypothetical protein
VKEERCICNAITKHNVTVRTWLTLLAPETTPIPVTADTVKVVFFALTDFEGKHLGDPENDLHASQCLKMTNIVSRYGMYGVDNSVYGNEMSRKEMSCDVWKQIVSKYVFCLKMCHLCTPYFIDKTVSVSKYVLMRGDVSKSNVSRNVLS